MSLSVQILRIAAADFDWLEKGLERLIRAPFRRCCTVFVTDSSRQCIEILKGGSGHVLLCVGVGVELLARGHQQVAFADLSSR
jgi:hypothetical protein